MTLPAPQHCHGYRPEDAPVAVVEEGDADSHDGSGWYYRDEELPEEGSCGAFATREDAVTDALGAGYRVGE